MTLRPLTRQDIDALHDLEAESYLPSLHESDAAFLRLIELFPEGAVGCFDEQGMCGYALGVPLTAIVEHDLYPAPAGVPLPIATRTQQYYSSCGLRTR